MPSEVAFTPDVAGSALLVSWRRVPIGFIRPLKRVPKPPANISAEARAALRAYHKPHVGKWYATMVDIGYWDTKEEAAKHLVHRVITSPLRSQSRLLQAAIGGGSAEVDRLLKELRETVRTQLGKD